MPREAAVRFAAGSSSTGLVRENNEDSAYVGRWLYAVADGLGGHVAGEIASATAIDSLRERDVQVAPEDLTEALGRAVGEANERLLREGEQEPALAGMGTTLTAMLWSGDCAAVAHIGDSRAYLLRDGRLVQISEDHSLGKLVAELAGSPRLGPVLVRYLDGRPDRSPDLILRRGRPGDRYLLCSDGLSGVVDAESMRQVLLSARAADQAVDQLIALANQGGGPDNITVIVVDLREADAEPAQPMLLGAAADTGA
jgi:serine/threonine protein phosphatase PrpC